MTKFVLWFLPFIMTTAHAQTLGTGNITPVSHEQKKAAQPYIRPSGVKSLKVTKPKPPEKSDCPITGLEVAPNPSVTFITAQITASEEGRITFIIYDAAGKKVKEDKNFAQAKGNQPYRLKTETLKPGTYLLQASFEANSNKQACIISKKFIKN